MTAEVRDLAETVMGIVCGNTAVDFMIGVSSSYFQIVLYSAAIMVQSPVLLMVVVFTIAIRLFADYKQNCIENDTISGFKKNARLFHYIDSAATGFEFAKEMRTNQADSMIEGKYEQNIRKRYELNTA